MDSPPSKSVSSSASSSACTELSPTLARAAGDPIAAESRGATDRIVAVLIWLANYGLSLSAADYALPATQERESACPFACLLQAFQKHV